MGKLLEKINPSPLAFSAIEHSVKSATQNNSALYISSSFDASIVKFNTIVKNTPYLLTIIGESGSGKSSLCEYYNTMAPENWLVCCVDAQVLTTPHSLLQKMDAGFPKITVGSEKKGLQRLLEHWQLAAQQIQIPVLVIDNGHLLSDQLLDTVLRLHKLRNSDGSSLVRIVLLSEHSLIERFELCNAFQFPEKYLTEKNLPVLALEEIEQYLAHRVEIGEMNLFPAFSLAELARLKLKSNGVPGIVNELANELAEKKALNVVTKRQMSKRLLTVTGAFVSVALVTLVAYAFVYSPLKDSSTVVLDLPVNMMSLPASRQVKVDPEQLEAFIVPILQKKLDVSENLQAELVSENQLLVKLSEDTTVAVVDAESFEQGDIQGENLVQKAVSKNVITNNTKRIPNGVTVQSWLNERNPAAYTIQLIGSSSKKRILDFINKSDIKDQLIYFHTQKKDKDWYAVVQGEYGSYKESSRALKVLSSELTTYGPWVRRFSSIQKEISRRSKNVNFISTTFASNE